MPEGHTVHRLARALTDLFAGQRLTVTSPQGRFAGGAALLDGRVLAGASAWGKQLFVDFVPADGGTRAPDDVRVLRVHLGLYGAWTFAGDGSAVVVQAIGAPRRRIGETETLPPVAGALDEPVPLPRGDESPASASGPEGDVALEVVADAPVPDWQPPAPRGAVRVRLRGVHAVADLTAPTTCEVLTPSEARAVVERLGPDPIRWGDAARAGTEPDPHDDPQRFVDAVRRSRTPVGARLMDQSVVAGVGNIYRAEVLYRARLDPFRPGSSVPVEDLRAVWDDLVELMLDGVRTGAIVTTLPEDRVPGGTTGRHRVRQNSDAVPGAVPSDASFYVYHREGLPCRVCGNPVLVREVAGRNLYSCATCQR
ncbi:formamidopyrimidine-DNA glycosylase [Luteimicrobium album]|uniref:DNA-(apurinic or apyrimidinic site) lyase n=1 Tax=Luteimicrobium album TaxID=1054550 RepID=A0ABQ6I8S5_9MICO|nr:DNA-formamidopyrimidine glycosylase family protein [Luteimicrobium album]GMA26568.1 formamidopyrimidine-DNA glycosylase [Luteimicrobium album]